MRSGLQHRKSKSLGGRHLVDSIPEFTVEKIAIVGSGFLGLTLALRLNELGHQVSVFESADQIGGLASTWQIGDIVWDKHYHVTLLSDSYVREIVRALGLEDEFRWVETRTGFFTDGKLVSMSNVIEFLQFPPLDFISKLRLGWSIFYASRVKDWRALEKVSVESWLTRLAGKKTFEQMWKPLLKAKLGEAYKETSAAFIWATIQRMYAARRSGLKKEMFGYVRGGYATTLGKFAEALRTKGVQIHLNARVASTRRQPDSKRLQVTLANGSTERDFDKVIVTTTPGIAAGICPELTSTEQQALADIRYQGIICASVLTKKSLSPYYVTNITDETPFTGIIEMSALVDKAEFGGQALIYLPKYIASDDPMFEQSDADIEQTFLAALERMYPRFSRADVLAFKVSRVREVFPVPTIRYSERLPSVKSSVDGLYLLNSGHITNGTLNVNETIQLAEKFVTKEFASHS